MAIRSDFFLCDAEDLAEVCQGWKQPLEAPRKVPSPWAPNSWMLSWAPDEPFAGATIRADLGADPVVEVLNLYNLCESELTDLCSAAANESIEISRPALVAPPESEQSVYQIPPEVVERLAEATAAELERITSAWVRLMRAGIEGIPSEFTRKSMLKVCTVETWFLAVESLAALAREAEEQGLEMFVRLAP